MQQAGTFRRAMPPIPRPAGGPGTQFSGSWATLMRFPSILPIPDEVLRISEKLEHAGFETWCVGGAIRDNLLGFEGKDFDLATAATPEQMQKLFRRTIPVGIDHGTVAILDRDNKPHEVTTFRKDVKTDGRHAVVEFGASLDEDLARRDFTINAIAYHPLKREWRDPFDGAGDLDAKVIRAVGDPAKRFQEDYLRILRALRFAARFGFEIEPATWQAANSNVAGLQHLSAERVRVEWFRGLEGARSVAEFVGLWWDIGALDAWLPEIGRGGEARGVGKEAQGIRGKGKGMPGEGIGKEEVGFGEQREGARDEREGIRGERIGVGEEGIGVREKGKGLREEEIGAREKREGEREKGKGITANGMGVKESAKGITQEEMGVGQKREGEGKKGKGITGNGIGEKEKVEGIREEGIAVGKKREGEREKEKEKGKGKGKTGEETGIGGNGKGHGGAGMGKGLMEALSGFVVRDPVLITSFLSGDPAATLTRLRCSRAEIERGRRIGRFRGGWPDPGSAVEVRRWMATVGHAVDDLVRLARVQGVAEGLEGAVRRVRASGAPLTIGDLAVSGDDLVEAGVRKGPRVGKTLERLLSIVLDNPALNTKDDLLARIEE